MGVFKKLRVRDLHGIDGTTVLEMREPLNFDVQS
jgi:hypothetical protein